MKKNIKIFAATKEYIDEIVKIHKDAVLETNAKHYPQDVVKEWIKQISYNSVLKSLSSSKYILLEVDKNIVGFAQYSLESCELYQINIKSKFQSKGYGRALYDSVEKDFILCKCPKISLYSTINAEKFYEALGFNKVGAIDYKLDKTSVCLVKMEKKIRDF